MAKFSIRRPNSHTYVLKKYSVFWDRNSHTENGGGEFAHAEKNSVGVGAFLISHMPRFADMVCKYLMCVIFWSHRCFFSVDVLGMGDEQHRITIMCV